MAGYRTYSSTPFVPMPSGSPIAPGIGIVNGPIYLGQAVQIAWIPGIDMNGNSVQARARISSIANPASFYDVDMGASGRFSFFNNLPAAAYQVRAAWLLNPAPLSITPVPVNTIPIGTPGTPVVETAPAVQVGSLL